MKSISVSKNVSGKNGTIKFFQGFSAYVLLFRKLGLKTETKVEFISLSKILMELGFKNIDWFIFAIWPLVSCYFFAYFDKFVK